MKTVVTKWKTALVCGVVVVGLTPPAFALGDYYLQFVDTVRAPAGSGSDCWGWTAADGTEYAFMGYHDGIMIVRTTPTVQIVDTKPGPTGSGGYIWRDFKTYGNYLYSVSEASGALSGISVYDLTFLPDSVRYVGSFSTNGGSEFTSHNINIDEARGFAYVEGSSAEQIRILNLADPENPAFVSSFGTASGQIHDMYAHDDTVWVSEGSNGSWSIWNLANKRTPQMIVRVNVPNSGYQHNIWPSEDRHYVVCTEETAGKTIKIYDTQDLGDIQLVSEYLAPGNLAHNAHWIGDFHVNSHYESGIQLMDVSDPLNPVEWDRVDTYPAGEGSGFNGCWGAFPFTQNGYVYASNINDGKLWVLEIANTCPIPDIPGSLEPIDGADPVIQPYLFTWDDVGADSYDFQVDEDPGFGTPDIDTSLAVSQYEVGGIPLYVTRYWRVRAIDSCGTSDWSATQTFTTGCIVPLTGDVNADGRITSADIIYGVNFVFKGGPAPQPVEAAGDVNCSGDVTSEDVIYMVNFVLKGGADPCDVCSPI